MSLLYLNFFSFFNTLSFILSSLNNTLLATVCSFLNSFFSSIIISTKASVFFYQSISFTCCQSIFLISPLANFISICSSLSKVSFFSSSMSTKVSPKLLHLFNNFFLIFFSSEILDLFILFLIF